MAIREPVFKPKLLTTLKTYNKAQLAKDLLSGLIVAVIAIPLSIAFGISSGVTPSQGLLTAAVAGFFISLLGGSRVQIGGPTGAFIVIVYGIVEKFGVEGLIIATFMAGIMLVLLGLFRSGSIIKYIPESIIVGFTAGIAVVIFTSQLKDGLGLQTAQLPGEFIPKIAMLFNALGSFNPWALILCFATIGIIYFFRYKFPRMPGAFIALVLGSLAAIAATEFTGTPLVSTIGSAYGTVTLSIVPLNFSTIGLQDVFRLLPAALSITFLGALESLLSAVVADGMIGDKHQPNTELIAQGIGNIASAFVGGIPATGAIARTAANVRNGARSPVAGISHAVFLFLIIVFFASWASYIPMAVLAGILIYVAVNMAEWKEFIAIIRTGRSEASIIITTFLCTIFVDLIFAIGAGLILSAFLFVRTIATRSQAGEVVASTDAIDPNTEETGSQGIKTMALSGAFFFGASALFEETVEPALHGGYKAIILRCEELTMIDSSGIRVVRNIITTARKNKMQVILSEVPGHVLGKLNRTEIPKLLEGYGTIAASYHDALAHARNLPVV